MRSVGIRWAAAFGLALVFPLSALVAQQPRKTLPTTGKMQIEVCDEQDRGLDEAKLHVSVWTSVKEFSAKRDYVCDAGGMANIDLPGELEILRIWATKAGHAGMFLNLEAGRAEDAFAMPAQFKFHLPRGRTIGGVVQSEAGQPIAGARVELRYEADETKNGEPIPSFFGDEDDAKTTDAQGRWLCDTVASGENVQVTATVRHSDYVSDLYLGESQRRCGVTMAQLRDHTARFVLQSGFAVAGKVTDPQGNPVASAIVARGDIPYINGLKLETRTDTAGNFQLRAIPAGPTRLTVIAEGLSPDSRKIEMGPTTPSADFQLKAGNKLLLKFVDPAGKPVPGVEAMIRQWRHSRALQNTRYSSAKQGIPGEADENGFFSWDGAPEDSVTFQFLKAGFAGVEASFTADGGEHIQILNPLLNISGTVRDAATGQSIDNFTAVPVIHFRPDFPMLDRQHAHKERVGQFNLEFDRTDIEHGVQIEALGYKVFRTDRRVQVGDEVAPLDVRLQPTQRYVGRVVDAAGQPVSGASVYVATNYQHLDVFDLKNRGGNFHSNYCVNSDAEGRFEIVGQIERYAVVVIAEQGFAQVERQAEELPGELRVQRWAKVTGQLIEALQPLTGCTVHLFPIRLRGNDEPRIDIRFSETTAGDGSFTFERVPPVASHVRGFLHFSVDSPLMSSRYMPLGLSPGEERHVVLGGGGAQITGKLLVENQPADFDYHFSISYLVAKRPGIDPPAWLASKGFDWRKGWEEAWQSTPEGGAYLNTLHHWFVKPAPDGHIRISGVEPGEYNLAVNLYGSTEGCLVYPMATRVVPITVSAGQSSLDLGTIRIPSLSLPKVGDPAPEFVFQTLGGEQQSLSSLRGKYVLIDFWATWCGPCVAKLDDVEFLRHQHAEKNDLVVIGANLDEDQVRAREFLSARSLPWQHALLGYWSDSDAPRRFAIAALPTYVLISPDGQMLAHETTLEAIAKLLPAAEHK